MSPPLEKPQDDMQLALLALDGRNGAFDELVRRHADDAFRFSMRLTGNRSDAEELSQEGFVRAFRALSEYRGESGFRPWLFTILANCHRDAIRSRLRRAGRMARLAREDSAPAEGIEAIDADELRLAVDRRIEALPDRQREVLTLHLGGRLDYAQIAAALGISRDDVKVNLSLARKRLREELKEILQ